VFDRSSPLPTGGYLEQADGTAWMGIFATDMAVIGLELCQHNPVYAHQVERFIQHFLYLGVSLNNIQGNIGGKGAELWDAHDGFYYDVLRCDGQSIPLKVRSMVGLLPLVASLAYPNGAFLASGLANQVLRALSTRTKLSQAHETLVHQGDNGIALASLVPKDRFAHILRHLLDEAEFLSAHGIRGLSKHHEKKPYTFYVGATPYSVGYVPGDSDSFLFGGNSNWRGPVWMPVNYILITALKRWHAHLGDGYKVEFPTGSKKQLTLLQVADELSRRLVSLFARGKDGRRPCNGGVDLFDHDKHWQDQLNFAEYFHGDNGKGIGATHQTGWTGLVAALIQEMAAAEAVPMPAVAAAPAKAAPAKAPLPAAKPAAKAAPAAKAKPAAAKPARRK
ncbi:MAG: glucosidase, partial [Planctomycetes bacterium]|nr:glucosidase [Planctomycetota bacterium]